MKTISIKLLLALVIFNLASCKKENNSSASLTEYQHADKPQTINCSNADSKLLNEAIYTFENDIAVFFDVQQKNVIRGYNFFMRQSTSSKKPDLKQFASEHAVSIAKTLDQSGIFKNGGLDYNNEVIKCLGENMKAGGLKTTFNALLSTNSMNKALYEPALAGKASSMDKDDYLGLYVALEYYYSEINKIDFSEVDYVKRDAENTKKAKPANPVNQMQSKSKTNPNVDFNRRPAN